MASLPNHHHTPPLSHDIDSDPEIAAVLHGRGGDKPNKSVGISTTTFNSTPSSDRISGALHSVDSDDELVTVKSGDLPIHSDRISMDAFVPSLSHIERHHIDSDDELLAVRDTGLTKTGARKSPGARRTGGPSASYKLEHDIDSHDEPAVKRQEGNGGIPITSAQGEASTGSLAKSAKSTGPKVLKAKKKPRKKPEVASSSARQDNTEGLRGRHERLDSDEHAQPMAQRLRRENLGEETNDDILGDSWTVPVPVAIGVMMCAPFIMMMIALWWNNSSKKG